MTDTESRVAPTPERHNHGPIDPPAEVISWDKRNRAVSGVAPRAVDTLGRMLRRGLITVEMARAGTRFRNDFYRANLGKLKCSDVSRPVVSGGMICDGDFDIDARNNTWMAICAVGGLASLNGSCLWHLIGLDEPISIWARVNKQQNDRATGILIGALDALKNHYNRTGEKSFGK